MRKKKAAAAGLIALLICTLLAGCGTEKEEPVEITLLHGWGTMESEHVRMREIYHDFEKIHPDIKLNMGALTSSDEVIKKVRDMLSVGEVPDLVFTGGYGRDSIYRFMVKNGKALDLMPYVKEDPAFAANISSNAMEFWTVDQKLYTVSDVLLAGGGYWYNEEIFKAAGVDSVPKTWTELIECCEKIKAWSEETGNDVLPVLLTKENSIYLMNALLLDSSDGGEDWVLKHEMNLGKADIDDAIEVMKKLYSFDDDTETGYGYRDVGDMFNADKVAIYINGVWASKLIDENIKAKYAPFPGKYGRTSACQSVALGYIVGNTGNQKKMDASVEFLKYLLSEEVQQRLFRQTGQMPSNPKVDLAEFKDIEPRLYQAIGEINKADRKIEVPSNFWSTEQAQYFENNIFAVLDEEITTGVFIKGLKEQPQ